MSPLGQFPVPKKTKALTPAAGSLLRKLTVPWANAPLARVERRLIARRLTRKGPITTAIMP